MNIETVWKLFIDKVSDSWMDEDDKHLMADELEKLGIKVDMQKMIDVSISVGHTPEQIIHQIELLGDMMLSTNSSDKTNISQ